MKITLDEATLSQAVITHLRSVGVQSDITSVVFRYTRVPYTVFAEVELADAALAVHGRPARVRVPIQLAVSEPEAPGGEVPTSIVDPDTLPPLEEPAAEEPRPDAPAAPLFGGG
jgi:hypothetical protein